MSSDFAIPRRSAGLYETLWPADHGDTARRKFVVGGGLPPGFDPARVTISENAELPYPQWLYTRNPDELFVYGVPGTPRARAYLAKVDSQTLAIKQKIVLPQQLYIGGALMHKSGDVYLIHGPQLYRFPQGDLDHPTTAPLPKINGFFSQYNGLQVAEDGRLVIKGWAMNTRELGMVWRLVLIFGGLGMALGLGAALLLALVGGGLSLGGLLGCVLAGPLLLALGFARRTGTSWVEFFRPTHKGWVLVVDEKTLKVIHQSQPPERCAYARTALTPVDGRYEMSPPHGEIPTTAPAEWYIIPGDEHILRFRYEAGALTYDPTWTERYRSWNDGTFPGTGPCVYHGVVYYTDNTFPVNLQRGYHLFRKPLDSAQPQQRVNVSGEDPGFMYFAVPLSPGAGDILIWDTYKGFLEARRLDDLSPHWRTTLRNTDCMTVAADRGHIYASDADEGLSLMHYMQAAARRDAWPHISKWFVTLDAETGRELLRLPLGRATPTASLIIPGMNNDVFCASRRALFRVHHPG